MNETEKERKREEKAAEKASKASKVGALDVGRIIEEVKVGGSARPAHLLTFANHVQKSYKRGSRRGMCGKRAFTIRKASVIP
jgi:hypothetical protein